MDTQRPSKKNGVMALVSFAISCGLTIPWIIVFKDAADAEDSPACSDNALVFSKFLFYYFIIALVIQFITQILVAYFNCAEKECNPACLKLSKFIQCIQCPVGLTFFILMCIAFDQREEKCPRFEDQIKAYFIFFWALIGFFMVLGCILALVAPSLIKRILKKNENQI
mmetsp:Transcript_13320/g.11400  ORF Transcript_13320/g.11400 Transcript_13320/m.11400 type:complete len:168 (+) Transcript_13320:53-556(+)